MKEYPILFSTPMVKAILEGRKTMTRRVVKPQPDRIVGRKPYWNIGGFRDWWEPWGRVGDRLWVRETWAFDTDDLYNPYYKADEDHPEIFKWKPSIHMPRWASRITLEITNVKIERLQDITDEDARAEGIEPFIGCAGNTLGYKSPVTTKKVLAVDAFQDIWDSINGKKYPWESNPYVWVISFRRIDTTSDNI